ncbi:TIGR02996 domain-containing protein [Hyalangium sp.]|uniref:TIGR02996 domain-containing protein n=1 Tax=Hyalangium sp. TaxID=2028555 RepID=UPI002D333A09|nr:TIGR02996 domain-containing protein [Hyalangium sp.]HYH95644.1 TIGR02996 domain-containing protein [Hyalangium sp.]
MRPDPALLAKIAAHPEAPEPRLACAQWLEAHGAGARAELIRAELSLRTRLNPEQRSTLNKRVKQLLKEHGKAWAEELPGVSAGDLSYRRGFVEELTLPEKRLAENGEELLAHEPVHKLTVSLQDGKGLGAAAGQPWFEQVRWLKLTGKVDAGAKALAAAAHVGKLDSLLLPGAKVSGISAVLGSERLSSLRTLSLTGGSEELDDEALGVFSQGRLKLERLFLSQCLMLEEGLSPLAEAEWLRPLKWLALNRNQLTDSAVKQLAESQVLENLERLELAHNEFTPEGVRILASPKVLPRLTHLDLSEMWWEKRKLDALKQRFGPGLKL